MIGKSLREVELICGHLWHRYSVSIDEVMLATVNTS
jgi:hypothetical protein